MELINEWRRQAGGKPGPATQASPLPERLQAALAGFEPDILSLHCYDDVRLPWVQVVFRELISPAAALRLGDVLAEVLGPKKVHLNSLRPQAVYFVLDERLDPPSDLPVGRYGAPLEDIRKAWTVAPAARTRSRQP